MMACLLGIAQACLVLLSPYFCQYEAKLHDSLLARQSARNLDSALAALRHCQPIYELSVIRARVYSQGVGMVSRDSIWLIDEPFVCHFTLPLFNKVKRSQEKRMAIPNKSYIFANWIAYVHEKRETNNNLFIHFFIIF